MRKLLIFALLSFFQLTNAAENDPPVQDAAPQEPEQVEPKSVVKAQEANSDADATENPDEKEDEEKSSARFIPTEEISQDFGVSFPVDI